MKVVPVNFNKEHKAMLGHCKMMLENDGGRIAINPDKFDKLVTAKNNKRSKYFKVKIWDKIVLLY